MNKIRLLFVFVVFYLCSSMASANSYDDFFAAIQRDNESAVIALALREFDLNTPSPDGDHGLIMALRQGSLKVADFLLDQSAVNVDALNRHGENALMMAALKGHLKQARRLVERGAQVNKPDWAPLHYAASTDRPQSLDMVRLLLEHHAYIDAASPNGTTPLMMAAFYGSTGLVELLLEEGADPLLRNQQGMSAIDFARRAGRTQDVDLIARAVRQRRPTGRW